MKKNNIYISTGYDIRHPIPSNRLIDSISKIGFNIFYNIYSRGVYEAMDNIEKSDAVLVVIDEACLSSTIMGVETSHALGLPSWDRINPFPVPTFFQKIIPIPNFIELLISERPDYAIVLENDLARDISTIISILDSYE